jgi:O-acetyl-ADP-ribose deacetylase (regulator of RNase III)
MSKIELVNGSCVEEEVDAIVNAANKYLLSGGGVCGAIFKKAGYEELTSACKSVKTPLNDGDAVITPAFNITNAKYVIHAVGPDFGKTPEAFNELFKAYYNSLLVLKANNLHSIAFPLISSGIFGGNLENPVAESVKECLMAYRKFTTEFPDYEIIVKLCAFSLIEMQEAEKHMR